MLPATTHLATHHKKPKSPGVVASPNNKTSVTCSNVPEALFDEATVKKHFSKFGRVQKIRLFPKRMMCIIEYDQPISAERAVLNAGAFDGFMFDVTRTKPRMRRRSKRDDDPDWVPDSDVEEELSAMSGASTYRMTRQKPMDIEPETSKLKTVREAKQSPVRKKISEPRKVRRENPSNTSQSTSGIESPVLVATTQTSLSTFEAAAELHQLRSRISLTPDEQWRAIDARDRILRAWGGAGSRVKVGGATIGTCSDMCPEKELLHRQAEHQVMTLETVLGSDGQLEPWRAVKQYSRSSADQEIPMCYELRPAVVLMRTCSYLLHEIADTTRQVSLADWFHFMWDRFRGIRKDIAQQALCCAESIRLVEICARFHAHCAARLADLEHTQFDQKLNTDNLTKCLQTLKHMYADVSSEQKPREAEFRGYIALLNLGDANFWWEIKQLPQEIQKSEPITFAMKIFNALDNNNYVNFFRLIKDKATYLQACILLRYFNDVRARALARIVKAYAPRGGSRFPADDLINALAFESVENMKSFICHYGLRFAKSDDLELTVILDRNQFIEDSDPYPMARSIKLIESKRKSTVCEVIAGGQISEADYKEHVLYTSFDREGKLKVPALIAEEQGYNTANDSNKDIQALKAEIQRLSQGGRSFVNTDRLPENKGNLFVMKLDTKAVSPKSVHTFVAPKNVPSEPKFSFKPAIQVAPTDIIKNSPEKIFGPDTKNIFSFSKPQESSGSNLFTKKDGVGVFTAAPGKSLFETKTVSETKNIFGVLSNEKEPYRSSKTPFSSTKPVNSAFKQQPFGHEFDNNFVSQRKILPEASSEIKSVFGSKNIFAKDENVKKSDKTEGSGNIFGKPATTQGKDETKRPNIFGSFGTPESSLFAKPTAYDGNPVFAHNGDGSSNKLSPGSLFKSACKPVNGSDTKNYFIFQSKNKAQSVADNILNSVSTAKSGIYDFDQHDNETEKQEEFNDETIIEEQRRLQEKLIEEEEIKQHELRRREERLKEEERKNQELKQVEEKRKREEEKRQEELMKKLEEEKQAELKRKAEEEEKKFREEVEKESIELVDEFINEVRNETVSDILMEEVKRLQKLVEYAGIVTEEILTELCNEMSTSETKAETFLTEKIMRKWFSVWRKQYIRNYKRRCLLEDTPVWLTEKTPVEEASNLKRLIENAALKNMNAVHRGYKFSGELKLIPPPEPYNIMELIRSPLLKRMKQINYPYDRCFFWKVTLVSPGEAKWLHRKINVEKWLLEAFSDKEKHESESLIHVGKQSWNHLMDFAISISLTNMDRGNDDEAVEGSNGMLFYAIENEHDLTKRIEKTLKHKYLYQQIPVAVIVPKVDVSLQYAVEELLTSYVKKNTISAFKIFIIDPQNVSDSLSACTKSALKWIAKKFPRIPPLEIDFVKSICQRYLGNDIWCRFKTERDSRMHNILKDLYKLIRCYNIAVDKLMEVITNEDHFNYSSFPLEFKKYLDDPSPYPKPYEFIPSCVKTSENVSAIKYILNQLKLPNPTSTFNPVCVDNMQQQIRTYCNQIGWFENPEEVVCKVVASLPNELLDLNMSCDDFTKNFEHYDLLDILNIIVYEKINGLKNFDNRLAIYDKSALQEYRNTDWLYETIVFSEMKHKAIEYKDDIDYFIEAKRRKIAMDSLEYLMLEDADRTLVEENIKATDESISMYDGCTEAVKQLEIQLDEGKKKAIEFENMLKAALSDV